MSRRGGKVGKRTAMQVREGERISDGKTHSGNDVSPSLALSSRRKHLQSTIRSGRTIGEKRERLETANERAAARKKDKQKKAFRVSFTTVSFIALGLVVIVLCISFLGKGESEPIAETTEIADAPKPTIEIIDEDAKAAGGKITGRMATYIGQAEQDFRDLGYTPVKAIIPSGGIREVDFYLEGYTGFVKMTIDRGSAVSAEDTDRLIRYLAAQGISDFQYLDVRIDGRAYWR